MCLNALQKNQSPTNRCFANQHRAVAKLARVKCGALFMEAGTGKTRAALELVRSTPADYVLWLTPFQTKENLRVELDKWGGLDCRIEGIESLSNSDRIYMELINDMDASSCAFVVVDESLKIKNSSATRTARVLELGGRSAFRLVLNGTPLSRNLLDLWSQMEFLSPKILRMRERDFKNQFCEYVRITYRQGRRSSVREFIKGYHNIDYLYGLIEPFIFESKLSLSVGVQHIDLPFELTDEETAEHDRIKEKYLDDEALLARNNNIFLELTQKMQHNYSRSPMKFQCLEKLLSEIDPARTLVFAKYIDTQVELRRRFPKLRVLSLQKHAFGLNLQYFNRVVFFDKTWDYAQREQAERRVYRVGQTSDCVYYDLTGNVGLEKMMNECIARKRTLLDLFSEKGIKAL